MIYFLDTSAVVKYYVTEPGSVWIRQYIDNSATILLAEITIAEVAAALGVLHRVNRISSHTREKFWRTFERDCVHRYELVPVGIDQIYSAAELCENNPLKAYDAVQLAVCLSLHSGLSEQVAPLVFVSGDDALIAAAQAEGMDVENPFWHTDLDSSPSSS